MADATMARIQEKLKRGELIARTSSDPDELHPITFELFPEELLEATAEDLKFERYIVDIHLFGLRAPEANAQVSITYAEEPQTVTAWLVSTRNYLGT